MATKLIVGLGNPGRKYAATLHNLGFRVADELARRWSLRFQENWRAKADVAEGVLAGQPALLIKPLTFMNLSGNAVAELVRNRELADDDLLVITDDVNLPMALAATWAMLKSDLVAASKLQLLFEFDVVLGLGLREWLASHRDVPQSIAVRVIQHSDLRKQRQYADSDRLRILI